VIPACEEFSFATRLRSVAIMPGNPDHVVDDPGATGPTEADAAGQVRAPSFKSVALPGEHGGWGLTVEPGLLGILVAPGWAGLCLALAALVAFLARTPVKLVLIDRRRDRSLPRTQLALRVAIVEVLLLVALIVVAALTASGTSWWIPAVVSAPLVAIELSYDMRSRSRRLVPELAGAVGIAGVAAMIVLADAADTPLAIGIWLILAGRVVSAIPHVRGQIFRLHGRLSSPSATVIGDFVAVAAAAGAVAFDRALVAGAVAVVALVVAQRLIALGPPRRAPIVGVVQTVFGFTVVVVTAIGVWVS
jgi:hypothetical protein